MGKLKNGLGIYLGQKDAETLPYEITHDSRIDTHVQPQMIKPPENKPSLRFEHKRALRGFFDL